MNGQQIDAVEREALEARIAAMATRIRNIGLTTPYDCTAIVAAMRDAGHGDWADALEDVARANALRNRLLNMHGDGQRHRVATEHLDLAIDLDRKKRQAEAATVRLQMAIGPFLRFAQAAERMLKMDPAHQITAGSKMAAPQLYAQHFLDLLSAMRSEPTP